MEPIFFALPWKPTGALPPEGTVRIHATKLRMRHVTQLPGFMSWSMGVRRQVLQSDGALGIKLLARPWSNTYYTLTAWRDEASVRAFVASSPHREIMARFPEVARVSESVFCSWTADAVRLQPRWKEAFVRIAAALDERSKVSGTA